MTELQHNRSLTPRCILIASQKPPKGEGAAYAGKEKEQDFSSNLFWLDFGARQYDPTRGQFTNYDPHCESYYNTNPLTYCGNNPICRIDPTGMDWYRNEDGTAAFWQEGSEESVTVGDVTYNNVGSSFSITYELDGSSYTFGFEQNVLQSSSIPIGRIYGNMEDNSEGRADESQLLSSAIAIPFDFANNIKRFENDIRWGSNGQLYYRTSNGCIFTGNQYVGTKNIKNPLMKGMALVNYPLQFSICSWNTYQGYLADGKTWGYNSTYQSSTGIAGIAGGWIGGKVGASIGATIGASCAGIGVIPGTIIGATVFGILGATGSSFVIGLGVDNIYKK